MNLQNPFSILAHGQGARRAQARPAAVPSLPRCTPGLRFPDRARDRV